MVCCFVACWCVVLACIVWRHRVATGLSVEVLAGGLCLSVRYRSAGQDPLEVLISTTHDKPLRPGLRPSKGVHLGLTQAETGPTTD
ncbi:unnamed protein product [Protopolystoma xenopodis]|uniref:Uncharacterized protein n=1 Tax=Protopolystoma xenopodis TaxID=117903 RepID=A0A448WB17_9PLAT|nr:unnamed protein product [Protopolystoma xenopodis]